MFASDFWIISASEEGVATTSDESHTSSNCQLGRSISGAQHTKNKERERNIHSWLEHSFESAESFPKTPSSTGFQVKRARAPSAFAFQHFSGVNALVELSGAEAAAMSSPVEVRTEGPVLGATAC